MKLKTVLGVPLAAAVLLLGGAVAGYTSLASAATTTGTTATPTAGFMQQRAPHVDGTITAINGSTVTITAEANHGGGTYTIDASSASVTKDGVASTLASFAVGDRFFAEGTITGTNVVATKVGNGFGGKGFGDFGRGHGRGPGVVGTVSSVNGSTITLTGKDGSTYTVEAGSATVQKMVTGSLSDVTVGDTIGVQGTVSGTSVTATSIMDNLPPPPAQ